MPPELSFSERRVLGVLIEKGFTTPEQYPLTLNGVVVGSNQKSCRDPASNLDEEAAMGTLESLRKKGFATLVRAEGSRADRWKHRFGETLVLNGKEMALLAELLLRGPQTDGELRQRAGRMVNYESLDEVSRLIEELSARPEPLIERITPPGRRRGVKYAHTFYPPAERPRDDREDVWDEVGAEASAPPSHARETPPRPVATTAGAAPVATHAARGEAHTGFAPAGAPVAEVADLRREIASLKERVEELEATLVKILR
jgi:uncharacterized protein YceH (UPF0502 family)